MYCDDYREDEPDYECFFEAADRGYEQKRINDWEPKIPSAKEQWLKSVEARLEETENWLNEKK
jgi:hypothetical protein